MKIKPHTIEDEIKQLSTEVKNMKKYLKTLIRLNLEQTKEVEPTKSEKRILSQSSQKVEFVRWDEIKDEI